MRYTASIKAGRILVDVTRSDLPLDRLISFASRENPKRFFYFVSKVMGKHLPARPSVMRAAYNALAEKVFSRESTVVVGLGEAATGLGAGVAHSLHLQGMSDVLYLYSTRQHLDRPLLCTFDEVHSHAPDHRLYRPEGDRLDLLRKARRLVLVDDELTTGRTIALLAQRLAPHMPALEEIVILSLISWAPASAKRELQRHFDVPVRFQSLMEGTFAFSPDPAYRPELPAHVESGISRTGARADTGRTGLLMPDDVITYKVGTVAREPVLVVGTAEFAFEPFLLAEQLENEGLDVLYLCTTRTPIALGDAIANRVEFSTTGGAVNYLYNVPFGRVCIACYETIAQSRDQGLRDVMPIVTAVLPGSKDSWLPVLTWGRQHTVSQHEFRNMSVAAEAMA